MSAPVKRYPADRLTPPGYYVEGETAGLCAHCGAAVLSHQGAQRMCSFPPQELDR